MLLSLAGADRADHPVVADGVRFLEANYRMCKYGVRVLPEGWVEHAPNTQMPEQNANGFRGKPFCYNPLVWGHVNERLPMFLFSHEFIERQAPM